MVSLNATPRCRAWPSSAAHLADHDNNEILAFLEVQALDCFVI